MGEGAAEPADVAWTVGRASQDLGIEGVHGGVIPAAQDGVVDPPQPEGRGGRRTGRGGREGPESGGTEEEDEKRRWRDGGGKAGAGAGAGAGPAAHDHPGDWEVGRFLAMLPVSFMKEERWTRLLPIDD